LIQRGEDFAEGLFVCSEMQDAGHFFLRGTAGTQIGHGQGGLD
jgi:hypothetical protein